MHGGAIISMIVFCSIVTAGCIQLPGVHIISNTPDPILGQWIGGELPASDWHIIFYENQTYFSSNYFLNRGEVTDSGNWTKKSSGLFTTQSVSGDITDWVYDSFEDSMYVTGLPQLKYHRYKG